MEKEYKLGSIVVMKKQHPCGSNEWEITRVGADIKIKCLNYYDLIGKIVTVCLNDESGTMLSTLDLEVVGL